MEQEQNAVQSPPRISARAGLSIGLISGLAMTLIMVALRFATDTMVLPEVLADWFTSITPSEVFDIILERLQVAAKPLMFGGILVGQVVLGAVLGLLYARYSPRLPLKESRVWERGILMAVAVWVVFMVVVTPLLGSGLFGSTLPDGPFPYMFTSLASFAAFGLSLTQLHSLVLSRSGYAMSTGRRELIQRAAFFAVLAAVGGLAIRTIVRGASAVTPSRVFTNAGRMPPEITPNDQFYEVSKNIVNPRVDAATWKLEFKGDFASPISLTYDDLQALPWKEQYLTLTCISNRIGGGLISNALWRGVPLKNLLETAQMASSVERLAFSAADGYVDSFPVEWALREDTLVAYRMNGEPLPDGHGFPARIIVPGLWGMENVKWLTAIETVPDTFRGYWQKRSWADSETINTMSRIDVPDRNAVFPVGGTLVGGIAFAGDRGITKVEFSVDGGTTWQSAEIGPALSPYSWILWTSQWDPPLPKPYNILVRSTDGTGEVQTAVVRGSLPSGATGHHRIMVTVQEPEASS